MQFAGCQGWQPGPGPVNETRNVATRPVQSWPSEPCGLALLLTTSRYSKKLEFRTEAQQATARPPAATPSPRPTLPGCALLEHPHTRAQFANAWRGGQRACGATPRSAHGGAAAAPGRPSARAGREQRPAAAGKRAPWGSSGPQVQPQRRLLSLTPLATCALLAGCCEAAQGAPAAGRRAALREQGLVATEAADRPLAGPPSASGVHK